ncbi:hypothetical protein BX600DRAFT_28193 [Xylariales sp. PMI_506]|nr:hypothetical protein BX600DRAFT_28193 [Xylariales sp. PMI_506]
MTPIVFLFFVGALTLSLSTKGLASPVNYISKTVHDIASVSTGVATSHSGTEASREHMSEYLAEIHTNFDGQKYSELKKTGSLYIDSSELEGIGYDVKNDQFVLGKPNSEGLDSTVGIDINASLTPSKAIAMDDGTLQVPPTETFRDKIIVPREPGLSNGVLTFFAPLDASNIHLISKGKTYTTWGTLTMTVSGMATPVVTRYTGEYSVISWTTVRGVGGTTLDGIHPGTTTVTRGLTVTSTEMIPTSTGPSSTPSTSNMPSQDITTSRVKTISDVVPAHSTISGVSLTTSSSTAVAAATSVGDVMGLLAGLAGVAVLL